jgi:HJR/Mrr/RecB family endonuclease
VTQKVPYDIIHKPKPIELAPTLRTSIERLLWYVPGIHSVQSYDNYLIDDKTYSEAVFDMILQTMNISRITDVKLVDEKGLTKTDRISLNKEICINCKKVVLTKYDNETILRAMLRHIRNAIAHGNFTVVGDMVLFKDEKNKNKTAEIKIDITSLDKALQQVEEYSGITQENVLAGVFKKLGYTVVREARYDDMIVDILLEKEGKKYGVEIKENKRSHQIGYQDSLIEALIERMRHYKKVSYTPVFVYDKIRVTQKAKDRLNKEGIILLDRKNVSELVNMKDVL